VLGGSRERTRHLEATTGAVIPSPVTPGITTRM
jgi:hypothetical protein